MTVVRRLDLIGASQGACGEACLDLILAGFGSPQKIGRAIQPDPKPFETALPQYDRLVLKPRSDGACS
jgi:hypothetical protein